MINDVVTATPTHVSDTNACLLAPTFLATPVPDNCGSNPGLSVYDPSAKLSNLSATIQKIKKIKQI